MVTSPPRVVVFRSRESPFELVIPTILINVSSWYRELFKRNEHIRSLVLAGIVMTFFYLMSIIIHDSMETGRYFMYFDSACGGGYFHYN